MSVAAMEFQIQKIANLVNQLVDGFPERIEYVARVKVHSRECLLRQSCMSPSRLKHFECQCREELENRAETVTQPALILQLREVRTLEAREQQEGGTRNKAKSVPPTSLDAAELLGTIRGIAEELRALLGESEGAPLPTAPLLRRIVSLSATTEDRDAIRYALSALSGSVRTARVLLGYDTPMRPLRDTSCGDCGGMLIVAPDATTDVRCVNRECGTVYHRWQWIELYGGRE